MHSELAEEPGIQARESGYAYLRNLVAAEVAVSRGQFNAAKVLRALAHAHRVLGMQAARLDTGNFSVTDVFQKNLAELESEAGLKQREKPELSVEARNQTQQSSVVRERMRDLMLRSIQSLETHPDVMESQVAQFLWGCYNCGFLVEGERPDACPNCGALAVEFQLFGPFYSATPEHIGQLTPAEILTLLEAIPAQLAESIAGVEEDTLRRKPSAEEWSAKEIIAHMLETDALFVRRVQRVLEDPANPDIRTPVPPWKLHEGQGYERMSVDEVLRRFGEQRAVSLEMVRRLQPEQWARLGNNAGTATSVLDLGTWLAHHDEGHSAQIRRLCGKSLY